MDELNALDGKGTARQLIDSGSGTITPYGVVYDNGMKLEQVYDGRFLPCYYYEPNAITVAVSSKIKPLGRQTNWNLFVQWVISQILCKHRFRCKTEQNIFKAGAAEAVSALSTK